MKPSRLSLASQQDIRLLQSALLMQPINTDNAENQERNVR